MSSIFIDLNVSDNAQPWLDPALWASTSHVFFTMHAIME